MEQFEFVYLNLFTFKEDYSDGWGICTEKVVHKVPSSPHISWLHPTSTSSVMRCTFNYLFPSLSKYLSFRYTFGSSSMAICYWVDGFPSWKPSSCSMNPGACSPHFWQFHILPYGRVMCVACLPGKASMELVPAVPTTLPASFHVVKAGSAFEEERKEKRERIMS